MFKGNDFIHLGMIKEHSSETSVICAIRGNSSPAWRQRRRRRRRRHGSGILGSILASEETSTAPPLASGFLRRQWKGIYKPRLSSSNPTNESEWVQ